MIYRTLSLLCFSLLHSISSLAQGFSLTEKNPAHLTVEMVSEQSTIAPGQSFRVALRVEHEDHWHTYGKTIAEDVTGKPTSILWSLPGGWKTGDLPWPPTKEVKSTGGTTTQGYAGVVYLPTLLTPPAGLAADATVKLEATLDALICDPSTCMPVKVKVLLELKVGTTPVADAKTAAVFKALDEEAKTVPTKKKGTEAVTRDGSIAYFLFLAFLGGIILNIMPCVFPVLAIKLTGVVHQAHDDKRKLMWHGLAYTLGVLVSLWIMASVLLTLRAAGSSLGWGFQLQSPWFVYVVVLVMVVFGLNMAGLFEIGTSVIGAGGELTAKSGLTGSFFSGLFATVVATPCTAPLLANALPVAFSLPAAGALGFFTVIGLGLAAPYLLLTLNPALLKKLPRPGAWMESFKQAMSFPMLAAAGYFAWVLMALISEESQRDLLIGLVVIAMALWIYGRWCVISKPAPVRRRALFATVAVLALGVWLSIPRNEDLWKKWSPDLVKILRDEKKPVYVDFTARWCATCQVNHRVYSDKSLREEIRKRGIVMLKADWTAYDPVITNTLEKEFHEQAVPVNVLYIPGREKPLVLPKLLTVDNMKAAFAELDKSK